MATKLKTVFQRSESKDYVDIELHAGFSAEYHLPATLRSNPNLQPEDSRSFSGGIVYTPKSLPSLTLTVDLSISKAKAE
jgi:outer membrane receptor protein involved in Fe transport